MADIKLSGTLTLTNTKPYPFSDSLQTVAFGKDLPSTDYSVLTEVLGTGDVGDLVVSGKAVNGFKLAYTGSAPSAVVRYVVLGGEAR